MNNVSTDVLIEVSGLSCAGSRGVALEGVSFALSSGDMAAILAEPKPLGVLLLNCLAGLAPAASGSVRVVGAEPMAWTAAERSRVVFVRGAARFPYAVRVEELLDHQALLMEDADGKDRALDTFQLGDLAPRFLHTLDPESQQMARIACSVIGDPDVLLSAMQSDEQLALMPRIAAVVATVEGYVDWVLDTLGGRLIPEYDRVTEALRRRRAEAGPSSRFVERLFGLELSQSTFDRGSQFVDGIVERSGTQALSQLWTDEANLPTPAELDAPGLWLARVGIESHDLELDDLPEFEIPDFPDMDS